MKLKELNEAAWIRVIVLVIGLALSLGGFVWLFFLSWRLGLCVFLILWGENILKWKDRRWATMRTETELLEKAKGLFKRLGGIGNADARIVRGLIEYIEGAKNTEQAAHEG